LLTFQVVLEKQIVVYISKEKTVLAAYIKSDVEHALNKQLVKSGNNGLYMGHVTLNPQSSGTFWYEIKCLSWHSSYTYGPFEIGSLDVHRDTLVFQDRSYILQGLQAHLIDIIDNCQTPFKNRCMQIENLCKAFSNVSLPDMLDCITKFIYSQNEESVALASLATILISGQTVALLKKTISREKAQRMCSVLFSQHLEMFPSSCQKAMIISSKALCEVSNPETYSLCLYIHNFFYFLGEEKVETVLEDHFEHSTVDICRDNDNSPDCIFQLLHDNTSLKKTTELKDILLRHLPVKTSITMYLIYCSHAKDSDTFLQSCKSRCLKELDNAVTSKDLIYLLEFPILIKETALIKDANLQSKVEKSVRSVVEASDRYTDTRMDQLFIQIIDMEYCFLEDKSKLGLLESLARSRQSCFREMFLRLISHVKFNDLFEHDTDTVYLTWLGTYIHYTKVSDNILNSIFCGAAQLITHGVKGVARKNILKYVNYTVEKLSSFEDFLKVSPKIEDCLKIPDDLESETQLRNLYIELFETKMKKNTTLGPNEMLLQCSQEESLMMHSR